MKSLKPTVLSQDSRVGLTQASESVHCKEGGRTSTSGKVWLVSVLLMGFSMVSSLVCLSVGKLVCGAPWASIFVGVSYHGNLLVWVLHRVGVPGCLEPTGQVKTVNMIRIPPQRADI